MTRRLRQTDRRRILKHLASRIAIKDDADLVDDVTRYCRRRGVIASSAEILAMTREAFQIRVSKRLRQLNNKIDSLHPDT